MTRYPRLFSAMFALSIQRDAAHRGNLLFALLQALVGAGVSLLTLRAVYVQTDDLAGWSGAEATILLGTFMMLSGLIATFVDPNLRWFASMLREGLLDAYLLRPVAGLFSVSLWLHAPPGLFQTLVGGLVTAGGIRALDIAPGLGNVVIWLVSLGASVGIVWSLRVWVALIAFWFPSLTLDVLHDAMWQFARYPPGIVGQPLRRLLTWVVPLAFAAGVPTRALSGTSPAWMPLAALLMATGTVGFTTTLWRFGLRRYTGATG